MRIGKSYSYREFLHWTRRKLYEVLLISSVPVLLHQLAGWRWLAIPLGVVLLVGTLLALSAGFRNTQTYNRSGEAQQIWSSIASSSRVWIIAIRDLIDSQRQRNALIHRHFAWLTALRYQMREPRAWETADSACNAEYRQFHRIPERDTPLAIALAKYLNADAITSTLAVRNPAARLLGEQSRTLKSMLIEGGVTGPIFFDLQKLLRDFNDQQGRSERIKNQPYPRQYAVINAVCVRIFCILLPLGLIPEFERMNALVDGFMQGQMVWLTIPCSTIIAWMYTALDQVGESTENPFEGSANDVPISQLCASIEADARELLGEPPLPVAMDAAGLIVM